MLKKIMLMLLVATPAMAQVPCSQFGGFYVGANVGWIQDDYQFDDVSKLSSRIDDGLAANVRVENNGVVGGIQLGYNWQSCCSLLGLEADWSGTSLNRSVLVEDGDRPTQDTLTVSNRVRWFGTVRGRAGVVVDKMLLYGTAGFAYAQTRQLSTFFNDNDFSQETFKTDRCRFGGVGGFGAEWAVNCRWSIKAECLYVIFAVDRRSGTSRVVDAGVPFRFQSHEHLAIARAGVNYRWGGNCCR